MESNNSDASHIGAVLLAGMCLAAGIVIGGLGRDSDRLLISQQSNRHLQKINWVGQKQGKMVFSHC